MSLKFDQYLNLEIKLPSTHPELLTGLDLWLQLGLISDTQVRQLCREFLVCHIVLQPQITPKPNHVETLQTTPDKPPVAKEPNILAKMLQSLGAELSVRWLLFLGMFLVVVSSGVLAATQWERFPPSGQYGVLLAYTLSFWGVSFWTGKQSNLSLTTQALLTVTLLLIPVNFWAVDSFQLWYNPVNWIVIAIAFVVLTAITVISCNPRLCATDNPIRKLPLLNILGLSYLHLGWQLPGFPLIAVYLATIGTAIATVSYSRYQRRQRLAQTENRQSQYRINLLSIVIIYAFIILLGRAIFIAQVDIQQLGLAIGICGWLVTDRLSNPTDNSPATNTASDRVIRTARNPVSRRNRVSVPADPSSIASATSSVPLFLPWELFGATLLFLGWLVSVGTSFPWQATAVSGLGLWFFNRRLQRGGVRVDVLALFVIGLEIIWLGWRLVPPESQRWAIAIGTQLTYSQNEPWALLSVVLFPYIFVMLVFVDRLYRADKGKLAIFGEQLTLIFGGILTLISLVNPTLRSLNLLLSTITLWRVSQQRTPVRISLVYMTQIAGVLAFCSILDRLLPNLSQQVWASLLLALVVAELLCSVGEGIWRRSAWHMGLGLATLSYGLLWDITEYAWRDIGNNTESWGLIWLIVPMTLTGIASWGYRTQSMEIARSDINTWFSIAALVLAQSLTLPLSGGRLIGLAIATAVMSVNSCYLTYNTNAVITVGYGLSFISALLWEGVPGLARLSTQGWCLVGALTIMSLWLVQQWLRKDENKVLTKIYAYAFDKWAIALCSVELLLLSIHSLLIYQELATAHFLYLISSTLILGAIVYRSWQQPNAWGFYGIGWCLELVIAEILGFSERSLIKIAIANIALGLITQLLGEWWQRRHRLERLPNRWHILPLIYGIFGVLLRWQTFASWTGLSSLAVAFIAIGVGRRRPELKPLVYLGLFGVSVSAYELLLYQLSQVSGGAYGDGLIAMSVLATGIMYTYRILSPWLLDYLRLSRAELKGVAHIHWAVSSVLLLFASFSPTEAKLLGLGTAFFLIRYAIFQGRLERDGEYIPPTSSSSLWVYLGLLETAFLRVYLPQTPLIESIEQQLLPWQGAIAAVAAYFIYILPWENWGWSKKPWQQAAYIIPLVFLLLSRVESHPLSLVIAASFYAIVAKISDTFRFTYLSVGLIDWALFRVFSYLNLTDPLWYVTPIGLSLLYVAQFNPYLRLPDMKDSRHFLRVLGCGVICGWAIIFNQDTPLIPGSFSLIAIFAGLALRVRAYLYVGVGTFFITSFYQLILFSLRYPFLKWVVGLLVGIMLISIAANFETRREQFNSLFRNTSEGLEEWE
jgi:hypothetical protein